MAGTKLIARNIIAYPWPLPPEGWDVTDYGEGSPHAHTFFFDGPGRNTMKFRGVLPESRVILHPDDPFPYTMVQ